MAEGLLCEVKNLKKYYIAQKDLLGHAVKTVKACDDVTFSMKKGETLGVVGESGCGKTTLGRTLLKLEEPTDGRIVFDGTDITKFSYREMRPFRKHMQIVFQDPYASINPRYTVLDCVREPLDVFKIGEPKDREKTVLDLLEYTGIPKAYAYRYPHELSGGQRQRVVIARAIISNPSLVVCDEAVSALDVSVRAQVLNLMRDIQRDMGVSYLFISHDISVVRYLSDRVLVMYLGKVMEEGSKHDVLDSPKHPYTKILLSAVPVPDVHAENRRILLEGDVPSPVNPPSGCRFRTRCPYARECCQQEQTLTDIGGGHLVACARCNEL